MAAPESRRFRRVSSLVSAAATRSSRASASAAATAGVAAGSGRAATGPSRRTSRSVGAETTVRPGARRAYGLVLRRHQGVELGARAVVGLVRSPPQRCAPPPRHGCSRRTPEEAGGRRVEDGAVAVPVESPERAPGQHHGVPAAGRHGLAHPRPLGWVVDGREPAGHAPREVGEQGHQDDGARGRDEDRRLPARPRCGPPLPRRAGSPTAPASAICVEQPGGDCLHEPGSGRGTPGTLGERENEARRPP